MGAALPELKYSDGAVEVRLRPSWIALFGIASMALATLGLLALIPGAPGLRILASTCVACAGLEAIHAIALRRGRRGARTILLRRSREIAVCSDNGLWRPGRVCDGSFVAPWLTIIRWRPDDRVFARSIVILPGMLDAESFRRLRVILRWS
jgi:toxin CptA